MTSFPVTTQFHEVFNVNSYFKVSYQNIIDILYYCVKEIGFTAHDILHELAFYEVLSLIDKWQEDVKEKNKQQEVENEKYEVMMSDMKRNQQMMSHNQKQNMPQMPKMPALPKI